MVKAYLLAWNPNKLGKEDIKDFIVEYKEDNPIFKWTCHSKQPKMGDECYFVCLGNNQKKGNKVYNQGIYAKGYIVKEPYQDKSWINEFKTKQYVHVFIEKSFDPFIEKVLPRKVLYEKISSDFLWAPQKSGIEIYPKVHQELNKYWDYFVKTQENKLNKT